MTRNKMMALKHICVFVLFMTLVNCNTYPPRIKSICLHVCINFSKYNNFKKINRMRQPKLEEIYM